MAKIKAADYVFPSTPEAAAKIRAEIARVVNVMHEVSTLKTDIDVICEEAEENLQIPKALLKKYATADFDQAKFLENKAIVDEIAEALGLADPVAAYSE